MTFTAALAGLPDYYKCYFVSFLEALWNNVPESHTVIAFLVCIRWVAAFILSLGALERQTCELEVAASSLQVVLTGNQR